MIEFSMVWWQFLLVGLGVNLVAYLAGVVVGKQSMVTLVLRQQSQMPQMPPGMGLGNSAARPPGAPL